MKTLLFAPQAYFGVFPAWDNVPSTLFLFPHLLFEDSLCISFIISSINFFSEVTSFLECLHLFLLLLSYYHKRSGFKKQKCILFQPGGQEPEIRVSGLTVRFWQGRAFSGALREKPFLASSNFWWLPALLGLWLHHSNICLCGYAALSSVCVRFPFDSFLKGQLWFRPHVDKLG